MKRRTIITALTVALICFSGCSSQEGYQPSGFLGDENIYSLMRYNPKYDVMEHIPDPAALSRYNTFIVPPVIILSASGKVDRDANKLAERLRGRIINALGSRYTQLNLPSKNTAVLRIALTEITPESALLNLGSSAMLGVLEAGGAAVEAEVIDSITGKRIAAVVNSQKGKKAGFLKGAKKWENVDRIFQMWANNLRARLAEQNSAAKASFGRFGE